MKTLIQKDIRSSMNVSSPPCHSRGSLTPPITLPNIPSSSFCSNAPTAWTTESAISSEAILSSMHKNGEEEKPFVCLVPGCKKRYKITRDPWHHTINFHPQMSAEIIRKLQQ
ncbi:unnamed protein product [Nyctereutes procyonoides]|uniref:(raccoon dog) hypothetical protein n=1 Tax=Nyctereutes procyonoides TaxID=34880 RepID=A0A811ZKX1_NYCPR|nr:unnamed protein product [Nyctereutes procyonoides]